MVRKAVKKVVIKAYNRESAIILDRLTREVYGEAMKLGINISIDK